ncbi:hypothetical protein T4B_4348 [Trichinella pseudospiralis]|uniref:Uncharacterized protein n=2 Tax=Trichinella pseudospiralis TaxID=6337 RepID=A0A0V1K712_TRIPS|nr:hypothetical protein T4A_14391 [Trichinella pseudospiralis]KRY90800.1 hypothetical protein T4D_2202 [Trichinella pseudospiralis]KRZ27057.1 hypothetical protein T4B_4348 [Trichinella pseudospiralis]KRZ43023.1 hypothetical protein T4C_7568 [Trichinella pseudospiralis]
MLQKIKQKITKKADAKMNKNNTCSTMLNFQRKEICIAKKMQTTEKNVQKEQRKAVNRAVLHTVTL